MDHFLSGLDSGQGPWYSARPMPGTHEFAIGNSSFQLIPITSNSMTIGNHSTVDTSEICNSDSNSNNQNSAFRPLNEVRIKSEGIGSAEENRQGRSGSPVPSVALTPVTKNKSHRAKSGDRWDTKKVCNICGKILSRGDKLKNHIRTHTNTFPYHCDACGQGFLRSEGLKVHTRIHTGERPYVCVLCGKAYTRKDKLTRHAVVHTGERPFVCQHCGKSFTRKDKMQRHELIHRVDKPFTCSPCNLEFVRQETLNMHLERKHPERLPYTLVHHQARVASPSYHPQGLDISGLIDSKSDIVKITEGPENDSNVTEGPSVTAEAHNVDGSGGGSGSNSVESTPNPAIINGGSTFVCAAPIYAVTVADNAAMSSASVLSSASLLTNSNIINGFHGPPLSTLVPLSGASGPLPPQT